MIGPTTSKPICASCGAEVPRDAPQGYCLKCLFALGTAEPDSLTADSPARGSPRPADGREVRGEGDQESPALRRSFGDYELLEEIARGGMGIIYRARQKSLGRIVAVKVLLFGDQSGQEQAQRFRAEAVAAASLQHPNIVAIHEVSAHEGQPFFAMEFIDGQNLARLSAECETRNSEWLRRAARYVKIVAEAIHYAHERGILHRDLKPSNVLIDPFDQPRVTDFGLAKRLHHDSDLTLSGQVLGSPNYMPPEQAAAKRGLVGRRSDVYSLGAILYHLLTARPPFVAETLTDTLLNVVNTEPISPRLLNPSVPRDLETLCLKCLEKEAARRYQTAQALAEDLDRFLQGEPIRARRIGRTSRVWRWCRRRPAVAGLIVALHVALALGLAGILWQWQRATKGEWAARTSERDARQKAYASDMNLAQQAVQADEFDRALKLLDRHRPAANPLRSSRREEALISKSEVRNSTSEPANAKVPSALNSQPASDLRGWEWRYWWRQCLGEERFILGAHAHGATAVGLLVDGKTAFSAGGDGMVHLWDLDSRRQIGQLPHAEAIIGAAASPDGRWLATASSKEAEGQPVLLWDLATHQIAAVLTTNFWLSPGSITFSPDSRWLAFATYFGGVRIWDVTTRRELTNLPSSGGSRLGVAFAPDSRTLACNEDDAGAIVLWDIARRSIVGRLAGHQSAVTALAFSPDGLTLASGSADKTARLWDVAQRRERFQFANHRGEFTSLAFSPDGQTLAMGGTGGAGRIIRLADVMTGELKAELRGHLSDIADLSITPDGRTLLSASDDNTIRVWDLAPRVKEKSVHVFARNSISSDWRSYGPALCLSPEGRHLLTVYTNQSFSLWDTLRLAERERHRLPFTNTTMAAVAPGGRMAAFASRQGEVVLWDVATSEKRFFAQIGANHIRRLVFSPDGRSLATADEFKLPSEMAGSNDDPRRTVRVWDVGAKKERHVLSPDGQFLWPLMFSADARLLIAGTWRGSVKLWRLDGSKEAATFLGRSGQVNGLALLPDGQTLISASGGIRFWDVRTRLEIDKLDPQGGWVSGLALSPDGRRLAAGSSDGRITIWDVASRQQVATLEGLEEAVEHLAFTPDGDHLVSASKDQLRVWRAASWAEIEAAGQQARK